MADTKLVDIISNIDSQDIAKLWAFIVFLVGFAWLVIPDELVKQYVTERKGNVEAQNMLLEAMGGTCLATSVTSLCMLLYESMTVVKAIGYCGVAWCLIYYKWIIEGKFAKAPKKDHMVATLLMSILTAYAGLYEVEWAVPVFKILILVCTLSALVGIISPPMGVQMCCGSNLDEKYTKSTQFCMKGMSFFLLGQELHNYLLLQGIAPNKAIAYSTIPGMCHFFSALYIGKEARREHVKERGYYVWLGIDLLVIGLLFYL